MKVIPKILRIPKRNTEQMSIRQSAKSEVCEVVNAFVELEECNNSCERRQLKINFKNKRFFDARLVCHNY